MKWLLKWGQKGTDTQIFFYLYLFFKLLTAFFFPLIRQEQRGCNGRVHRPGGAAEKKIRVQRLTSNHDRKMAAPSAG